MHGSAVVAGERLTAKEYIFAWLNERLPDLGVVSRIDVEEGELAVDFDGQEGIYGFGELDELVLAYVTTIHTSQGLEYPAVLIPLTDAALPDAWSAAAQTRPTIGLRSTSRPPTLSRPRTGCGASWP